MVDSGRVRLGEMLVEAQLLSRQQLDGVLERQRCDGRRVGSILVESGLISEVQLTQLLSQQLSVPWVSLYHIDFSRKLLELVSRPLAEQYCLIPVFVRRVKGIGQVLYIAMDDPGDEDAKLAVAEYSGLPVRAMIAPPSDIRNAIRAYYGGLEAARTASAQPAPSLDHGRETVADIVPSGGLYAIESELPTTMPSMPPAASAEPSRSAERAEGLVFRAMDDSALRSDPERREGTVGPDASQDTANSRANVAASSGVSGDAVSESEVPPRASNFPPPRRGVPTKGVTLTLLDGTEIVLPARPTGGEPGVSVTTGHLTARDLVQALMATGQGADASEVFGGTPRWEHVVAALLSILLKKHLVADWEFADEYRRLTEGH